jgi:RNA polymerase sigma-70 factor (ECF subfamily)
VPESAPRAPRQRVRGSTKLPDFPRFSPSLGFVSVAFPAGTPVAEGENMSSQTAFQRSSDLDSDTLDTNSLYRKYHDTVTRWANRLIHSPSDAEDIAQEVFLVLERRRGDYTRLQNPASLLYRITANIVRHRWRDQQRHGAVGAESLADLPDLTPSPLDDLERRRELELFDRAFESLNDSQRELLLMWDVRRLATSDISAITGVKAETLRVRRFRARLLITRRLKELENAHPATQTTLDQHDLRALKREPANYNDRESTLVGAS